MLALEDYTVDNVPGYGSLGRGDMSYEIKAAAVNGRLNQLIAKNSWGKNRPDRGLTDGYTGFDSAYLNGQFPWTNETDHSVSWYTTTTAFVLPPGF